MSNWIIHIVGEALDDDLAPAITKFVNEIESLNHKVHQIRLTTDTGEKILNVAHAAGDVVEVLDPASTSDVAKIESDVTSVVTSHEGLAPPSPSFKPNA